MPGVVLDAVAVADLLHHLEIEHRALVQALRLEELALGLELAAVPRELGLDRLDRLLGAIARRDEVRLRVDRDLVVLAQGLAGQRIEGRQRVDFVAEELDAERQVLVRRVDLDDVAAHAERRRG